MRIWLSLVLVVLAAPAFAQKRQKVVIDSPPAAAKAVKAALRKYEAVPAAKPLSATPLTKEIREACAPSGAIAVVMVRAIAGGYSIQVLNASDGTPLDTFDFRSPPRRPVKSLPKPAAAQLVTALREARAYATGPVEPPKPAAAPTPAHAPAPAPPPEPVAKAPPAEPTPAPSARATAEVVNEVSVSPVSPPVADQRPAFRASFGFRGFNRSLTWDKTKSEALSGYDVGFAPAVAVDATVFPAAPFTSGFASNLGATAQADLGVGLVSQPRGDSSQFGTSTIRFRVGAVVRLPISTSFEANGVMGYSSQTFAVANVSTNGAVSRPALPGVAFNGPRAALGVRLSHLGPVSIDAGVGFMLAIGKGELSTELFFPRASAFGLDASAGVSLELASHLEARLGVDYARYFISTNANGTEVVAAVSSADQYLSGSISMVFVL